ncbi:MAG TPA: IS21 family transposase [Candidatus Paenibacillus intestinavium]|nr:IS21 family transposase [Candidatus Paenibacillus intestinavium]
MYMTLDVQTEFEIHSLLDLPKFKSLMENLKMKINRSQLARELDVDPRTIQKYLDGFTKKTTKDKGSKIDEYYEIIAALLSEDSKQVFYYKRVLWQYLKDNHGLDCSASAFRAYIARKPAFEAYFKQGRRLPSPQGTIRFETAPGVQAQLDWKESIRFETREGENVEINVAVLLLSYSRFRFYHMSITKSQAVLMSFLTEAFETLGGVPHELLTDNMKTVMDEARTEQSAGKVNAKFHQFATDFGCKVKPCVAGRPRTKGKVEAQMKLLDEIHAYQGKLSLPELHDFIQKLCNRINQSFHQGSGNVPVLSLEKEKNSLHPLPTERVRSSYRIHHKLVKINASNMISYQSRQYSVPAGYQGKTVGIQVYDNHLYAYYNTKLLVRHPLGETRLNYKEEHYRENLRLSMPSYPDINDLAKKNLRTIGGVFE